MTLGEAIDSAGTDATGSEATGAESTGTDATETGKKIGVLLVDDHEVVRAGLTALLSTAADIAIVGQAGDGAGALSLVAELTATDDRLDVVLMDLSMPVMDGVEATRAIADSHPQVQVLVLTSFSDRARVRDAMTAGASGYLLKDCSPEELLSAVRSAAAGHNPLDPRVAGALLPDRSGAADAAQTPGPTDIPTDTKPSDPRYTDVRGRRRAESDLSEREREVLQLVSKGLANKQVARQLGITERTVKVHLGNVFRRIGVGDRTSAALWARENLP